MGDPLLDKCILNQIFSFRESASIGNSYNLFDYFLVEFVFSVNESALSILGALNRDRVFEHDTYS